MMIQARRAARGWPGLFVATVALTGCTAPALDDRGKIVRATLRVLAEDRAVAAAPLCVDDRTRGEPLAIFRTMRARGNDHDLRWRHPAPLHASQHVSNRALFEDAIGRNRLRIAEPRSTEAVLPAADQRRLDGVATNLAIAGPSEAITIGSTAAAPGIAPRWWLINRARGDCARTYVLSRVVDNGRTGFVTVTADHWGTTYAVEREGADWRVVAKWNSWLY
jgi:hypothetical protein